MYNNQQLYMMLCEKTKSPIYRQGAMVGDDKQEL